VDVLNFVLMVWINGCRCLEWWALSSY